MEQSDRNLLLGVDGGATKTDAVLCDGQGRVIRRVIGPASNPNALGETAALEQLAHTLEAVLKPGDGFRTRLSGVFAGIAGIGIAPWQECFMERLRSLLTNAAAVQCGTDALNALYGALGDRDGVVAIAGTGACVYARRGEELRRVSGWGCLFGDEGSGYALGRGALAAAMRSADGRDSPTLLLELCERRLGGTLWDKVSELYRMSRTQVAAFAPLVSQAAGQGDETACRILEGQSEELSHAIETAAAWLGGSSVAVVLTGSLWRCVPGLYVRVCRRLGEGYAVTLPELPPVYGAVRRAAVLAGCAADNGFECNFTETLQEGEPV